jgi:hypothetical protein
MTLQQTVTIPADRRLHLDLPLPENLPSGVAKLTCIIKPLQEGIFARKRRNRFEKALDAAIAQCKGKDLWGPDSVEYVRKLRDEW